MKMIVSAMEDNINQLKVLHYSNLETHHLQLV